MFQPCGYAQAFDLLPEVRDEHRTHKPPSPCPQGHHLVTRTGSTVVGTSPLELPAHDLSWRPGPRTARSQGGQQAGWVGAVLGASSGQWELLCAPSQLLSCGMFCNVHSFVPAEPCLSQGLTHMLLLCGERRSICLSQGNWGSRHLPRGVGTAGMQLVWDHEGSPRECWGS